MALPPGFQAVEEPANLPPGFQPLPAGRTAGQKTLGILEALGTLASGALAEPLAGLAGIGAAVIPGGKTGAEAVESTREALTFQPRTEAGQEAIQAVGEFVEPVAKAFSGAEDFLGQQTLQLTGSPALAAAAATIPTALAEVLGLVAGKAAVRGRRGVTEKQLTRELSDAVPTVDELKNTSRAVFKEIDELGVSINQDSFLDFAVNLERDLAKAGVDPDITPASAKALRKISDSVGSDLTLTELGNLRAVAQNAAASTIPSDRRLGSMIVESIDEFLDKAGPEDLNIPEGVAGTISSRYRVARDLWGRARRSELIADSMEAARNQASGFENGIRVQFRKILNNKRQRRFFNEDEIAAIRQVVEGTPGANLAKLGGRFGFSEGSATNVLGGVAGGAVGGAIAGIPGAIIVPAIGQVSRKLAQRLTEGNARFADEVIRSGKDGRKIAAAYLRNTPKAKRSSAELSELLMNKDINLTSLSGDFASILGNDEFVINAARMASNRRNALATAAAAGAAAPEEQ